MEEVRSISAGYITCGEPKIRNMTPEELEGKAVIGCFRNEPDVPEYTAEYTKLIERLKKA